MNKRIPVLLLFLSLCIFITLIVAFVYYNQPIITSNQTETIKASSTFVPNKTNTVKGNPPYENILTNNTVLNETKTKYTIVTVPAPKNVTFEEEKVNFTCSVGIEVQKVYHGEILNNVSFIIHKGDEIINFTLRGVDGKYACFPEGIFLISYYPDGLVRSRVLFLDYNLSVRWEKIVEGGIPFFEYYEDGLLIFSNRPTNVDPYNIPPTIYGVKLSSGELLFSLKLMGKAISNLKIFNGKVYYASYRSISSEQKTYVYVSVYDLKSREYKFKQVQARNVDHYILGADLKVDVNEGFIALAYYLSDWVGRSDLKLCVFTKNLELIECEKISATPWHIKLEGDTVYIEGDPNAYKIVKGT
ncbi:hypothetical protein E3E22_00570 [Thermococcus sp. MV5]|uniref:hypothetical protein n=1 Tax=Thermococcus sp. MV5 TaxID=1638272 RepID=UPI00143C6F92|nr:hypothetical protein [Thermococcus sp. MV5]NJE25145.1 hypothetical protein [Thermococcus sp. MV5]